LQLSGEVLPELEVGLDPQVPLTKRDEGRDMLNPIGIQMLWLDPIVVKELAEELVGGDANPLRGSA
jgi:hypothetical protein